MAIADPDAHPGVDYEEPVPSLETDLARLERAAVQRFQANYANVDRSALGVARLNPIVRANRNVQCLLRVSVEVTDQEAEAAVGILIPALVRGRDAGAALPRRAHRQHAWLLGGGKHAADDHCRDDHRNAPFFQATHDLIGAHGRAPRDYFAIANG